MIDWNAIIFDMTYMTDQDAHLMSLSRCPAAAAALAIVLLVVAPALAAIELPVQLPAETSHLAIELDSADLTIVFEAGAEEVITAKPTSDAVDPAPLLELDRSGSRLTLIRGDAAAADPPLLSLELHLEPARGLSVKGRDLRLAATRVVEQPEDEPADEVDELQLPSERQPGDAQAPVRELAVEDSQIAVLAITGLAMTARNSVLHADETRGSMSLELEGGMAEVRRHHGHLEIRESEAEVTLDGVRRAVTFKLQGGSLASRNGVGRLKGHVNGSLLQVSNWKGGVFVSGGDSSVDIRNSRSKQMKLDGVDLTVYLDQWTGPVNVGLRGGSLRGEEWTGEVSVTAQGGAIVEAGTLRGPVNLILKDDASASLIGIIGDLKAAVDNSTLRAEDVRALAIAATYAHVTASGINRLTDLKASFSELDLDLREIRGQIGLGLQQGTRARIRLSTPCQVRSSGPGSGLGNQVTVNGCAYAPLDRRGRTVGRGVQGERPVTLNVTMAQETELEVDGVP